MKIKTISMLAIMALLIVGTVVGVYAASDDAGVEEVVDCDVEGGESTRGCTYHCTWCPGSGSNCDDGGRCC